MPRVKSSAALQTSSRPTPVQTIFVGTSGWAYPSWKPGFYPEGAGAKTMLTYYASQLNSVEVNHSFRKLPSAAAVQEWLARSGPGFQLSFKAPQRITHFSRLRAAGAYVAEFVAALQPVVAAGRLGLLLFQLPPNFKADPALLDDFLSLPAFTPAAGAPPLRIAFEFRHDSWFSDAIYETLQRHDAAMCLAENERLTTPEVHTAHSFTALRLRHPGGYEPRQIDAFATRFAALAADPVQPRTVYAYFKHEDEPTGVLNAVALRVALAKLQGRESR